ncbi:30S ribosomal protein THX [Chitinophaga rhizosphaerae]|nr:30S ribosomal protein THX [Chitinophaga rhizosphaerae]
MLFLFLQPEALPQEATSPYHSSIKNHSTMGRGDIKTKKGKISNGSFGKSRPAKTKKATAAKAAAKKA